MEQRDTQLLRVENFPKVGKIIRRRRSSLFVSSEVVEDNVVDSVEDVKEVELNKDFQFERFNSLLIITAVVFLLNSMIMISVLLSKRGLLSQQLIAENLTTYRRTSANGKFANF